MRKKSKYKLIDHHHPSIKGDKTAEQLRVIRLICCPGSYFPSLPLSSSSAIANGTNIWTDALTIYNLSTVVLSITQKSKIKVLSMCEMLHLICSQILSSTFKLKFKISMRVVRVFSYQIKSFFLDLDVA